VTDAAGRERLAWLAVPAVLLGLLLLFLTVGRTGPPRAELDQIAVADVLAVEDPAAHFGSEELQVVGWYANLDADCVPPADTPPATTWLDQPCPLNLLLNEQPAPGASQAALEGIGLRLAAPTGEPFPPRPRPAGWNVMLEEMVATGHFDDAAAEDCPSDRIDRCRATFVVTATDGLVH
jgi:hypothetical protein